MAIVSGDVAGYARLIATDETAAVRLLSELRQEVERHVSLQEGELFDFTGDNFLAGFSSARSAVLFAIGLQEKVAECNSGLPRDRRMEFRLGVHQGDVRVEDHRVFGTGVNIAARLESSGDPGGVNISSAVREQILGRLDLECEDLGERTVKNIPNPVRVYRILLGASGPSHNLAAPTARQKWILGGGVLGLVAALAVGLFLLRGEVSTHSPSVPREPTHDPGKDPHSSARQLPGTTSRAYPDLPDKPSIVVLPFSNMSADPEQDYFADGFTEDLTTDLSRIPQLFVIARNSAFTYKGRAVDVEQVGRELGVRYLLEGSLRKLSGRVRINAQLIDTTTGFHLWADRYDGALSEMFELQAEIGGKILRALEIEIGEAERTRVQQTRIADLTAYESWLRGRGLIRRPTRESVAEGSRLIERAIELEPRYAEAHAELSSAYLTEYAGWNHDPAVLDRAEASARRAVELDAHNAESRYALGSVYMARAQPGEALPHLEKAVELMPNSHMARSLLGFAQLQVGMLDEAIENLETAMRLNVRVADITWTILGYARYLQGRVDDAVSLWEQARAVSPDPVPARLALIVHYQSSGEDVPARRIASEILSANPDYTAALAASILTQKGLVPKDVSDLVLISLQSAGLP